MTKCGKSFLPECEYFATNGCVSPFNCPYKIENESITTATSTPCNHYPLETDKDKEISRLQAEVAELRERLEKAVELPYERKRLLWGDKDKESLLCPDCLTDVMGGIGDETFVVQCPNCGCFVNSAIEPIEFTATTEARLKELKEEI